MANEQDFYDSYDANRVQIKDHIGQQLTSLTEEYSTVLSRID